MEDGLGGKFESEVPEIMGSERCVHCLHQCCSREQQACKFIFLFTQPCGLSLMDCFPYMIAVMLIILVTFSIL